MMEKIWQKSIAVLFCQLVFVLVFCGVPAFAQDAIKTDALLTKISTSYEKSHGAWQVMSLSACGMGDAADKEALLSETLSAVSDGTTDATLLQRNIIALTAAGYNCTELPQGNDSVDAVSAMAAKVGTDALINAKVSTMLAYASGEYAVPKDAKLSEQELIASICAAQLKDGGFTFYGTVTDADMTALAINALLPYTEGNEEARQAVEQAREALLSKRLVDGTWPSGSQSVGNANSTAFAIIALCALGVDPQQPLEGCEVTPLDALLTFANDDNSGFLYGGKTNALATEQGFRALVACKGFAAAQGAYNIYTQAAGATAVFTPVEIEGSEAENGDNATVVPAETTSGDKNTTSDSKKSKKSAKSKKTKSKASSSASSSSSSSASSGTTSSGWTSDDEDEDDDGYWDDDEDYEDYGDLGYDDDEFYDDEEFENGDEELEASTLEKGIGSESTGDSLNAAAWWLIAAGILLLVGAAVLCLRWGKNGKGERQ